MDIEEYRRHSHSLRCHQCSMVFTSIQQLSKHREKFCVGSYNEERYNPYTLINNDKQLAEEKIRQLQSFKAANARQNEEANQRDRLVVSQASQQEKDFQRSQLGQQLNQQVNKLNSSHSKHLKDLKEHRNNLREARKEILDKIAQLKHGSEVKGQLYMSTEGGAEPDPTDQIAIRDLRNQINLLRTNLARGGGADDPPVLQPQVVQPLHYQYPTMQPTNPLQHKSNQFSSGPTNLPQQHQRFNFSGGTLTQEIRALRQHYVNTGGKDPVVIDELSDMLQDAEHLERRNQYPHHTTQHPQSVGALSPAYPMTEELMAMEMENYRLQRELVMLENNRGDNTSRPGSFMDLRLQQLEQDHMTRLMSLQRELELSRHQALVDSRGRDVRPDNSHQFSSYYHPVSNITSSGYSAGEGFVCFYDFVMGLESSARHCKLVVGLYNSVVEYGEPAMLPTVFTELTDGGNTAMIGARQPVPQCPPSKDLGLVVELQTSDSTPENLRTKAWLKLDLFNDRNALLSGAWKVQFRCPPIRPELSASAMTSLPVYSKATLYIRLVNYRDSYKQSESVISPANHIDYKSPQHPINAETTPYSWDP